MVWMRQISRPFLVPLTNIENWVVPLGGGRDQPCPLGLYGYKRGAQNWCACATKIKQWGVFRPLICVLTLLTAANAQSPF